ncbi:hypothetical protein C6401_10815 [Arthrobacter woluwensis]|uniref:hypothetical protein n=1 Tax=Arthrobacter woluwensis TaxID=156980 RepID=UPI000D123B36|nr:hypothetical protein [Arthrobacter woluwensis]PSS43616.1 hypothetical protein C6401_10815 [Arthrobacter woluwensis]
MKTAVNEKAAGIAVPAAAGSPAAHEKESLTRQGAHTKLTKHEAELLVLSKCEGQLDQYGTGIYQAISLTRWLRFLLGAAVNQWDVVGLLEALEEARDLKNNTHPNLVENAAGTVSNRAELSDIIEARIQDELADVLSAVEFRPEGAPVEGVSA